MDKYNNWLLYSFHGQKLSEI